ARADGPVPARDGARPARDARPAACRGGGAGGRGVTAAEALVTALDDAGYRLTEPRRTVAGLVAAREGHFTAADLVDDARRRRLRIGRATIFRALDVFADLRLVERIDLPDGDHAY